MVMRAMSGRHRKPARSLQRTETHAAADCVWMVASGLQGRERELAEFLQSLGSLRQSIAQEQEQTVSEIRAR
eukprot:COSAG02_NODE_44089_length_369_cov_0.629630_1_plen_71_part_10